MNFFKALFGGSEETPEQKQQADEARRFDMFKYDGVKAPLMQKVQPPHPTRPSRFGHDRWASTPTRYTLCP